MASGSGKSRLEASQKTRNDHELFLEAYERPTQIYRFLKARHSLEPLFLQRNLSYMKDRRAKSKQNKIGLANLVRTAQDGCDLAQEVKSDSHLILSFESVSKGDNFPRPGSASDDESDGIDRELFKNDETLMEVEVVLCRFKHPTPEALLTSNPSSLSCVSTSLGKCVVSRNTLSHSDSSHSSTDSNASCISIPSSVLSWKGTSGVLGTHMLVFRVSPFAEGINGFSEHKTKRKRNTPSRKNLTVATEKAPTEQENGTETYLADTSTGKEHSAILNGMINRPSLKRKNKKNNSVVERTSLNGHIGGGIQMSKYTPEMLKRLRRKVPGGKTLPTVSTASKEEKLMVSVPRNLLQKQNHNEDSATPKVRIHRKRTQLELLIEAGIKHIQGSMDHEVEKTNSVTMSNKTKEAVDCPPDATDHMPSSPPNSRKRQINSSALTKGELKTQPPTNKKARLVDEKLDMENNLLPTPSLSACNGWSKLQRLGVYSAQLVAFDSRKECLLVDGEYELLMQCASSQDDGKKDQGETTGVNVFRAFSPFDKDTIFGMKDSEVFNQSTLTLKFTAKWVPSPPKPRPNDMLKTALDLLKLRKSYNGMSPSSDSNLSVSREGDVSDSLTSAMSSNMPVGLRSSTPCPTKPTIFNFFYNNDSLQQTELKENFICPWCSLDCKKLYCLLKHMTLCHPRFKFTYNPSEKGVPCVNVSLNRHYGTKTSCSDPVVTMGRDALIVRKQPTRLKPTTSVLVERCRQCNTFDLKEFTHRKQLTIPELSRTFYHSKSCLPMLPNDKDSEDEEGTAEWLKMTSMKMVDEFIDVNFGEKQFMKVWNSFMMDNRILADKQIPQTCIKFAKERLDELKEKNIVYNLMSHVTYMCDIGLIPSTAIREIFKIVTEDCTVT